MKVATQEPDEINNQINDQADGQNTPVQTDTGTPIDDKDQVAEPISRETSWQGFSIIFGLALALRLFYNFAGGHPNAFAAADASEYIRYTTALSKLVSGTGGGVEILKEFIITGPSLPVFLLFANFFTGHAFNGADSVTPLIAQSLLSAATAGLIYLMAGRLYNGRTALIAGALAAVYPAFIVNSGRLYSETFATFIECLSLLLMIRGLSRLTTLKLAANNLALGASLVILQLARSAMILLTAVTLPLVFLQGLFTKASPNWRRALLSVAFVLIGSVIVLAPWLAFQKTAYNKTTLVVDRVGHYNLFVGTNTKTQGFLSYPYPDGHGIEEHSFPSLILRAFKQSPSRFIKLCLDKPARLFKMPWNDFRAPIGFVDYKWQVALHQAIVLLFIIGILLAGVTDLNNTDKPKESDEKNRSYQYFGRAIILLAFALNLPYLAFITVPRYNLTAMPTLIIFAAAGLTTIIHLLRQNALAKAPKVLAFAALALFVFLRDDLKDPFSLGQAAMFNVSAVTGTDPLSRGLIAAAFALALFAAIYVCISDLRGHKRIARGATIIAALLMIPLVALPQRANGRPGENIITFARPKEEVLGKIKLPASAMSQNGAWYLAVDCANPTMFNHDLILTVNGKKVTGPFIPGIAALDDWHYLKPMGNGYDYLECEYIFDCMTQPTAISNLDLRQWFYIPLSPEMIAAAKARKALDITISHQSDEPSTLFAASTAHGEELLPCRDLYSWEKCFYGVENDSGLTDSRYDEKLPRRDSSWRVNYEKTSEELSAVDLNIRLWCQPPAHESSPDRSQSTAGSEVKISDKGMARLDLDPLAKSEGEGMTLLRAHLGQGKNLILPTMMLVWSDKQNKVVNMRLPWLKASADNLDIAIPCDLSQIIKEGGHKIVLVVAGEGGRPIELSARTIGQHPIFGQGQIY